MTTNIKLIILGLIFAGIFIGLGNWQLSRAHQKESLLASFTERTVHQPFTAQELNQLDDQRFYQAKLTGSFDNTHTLLLDNRTYQGKIGYEVYTPFRAQGLNSVILVDRGFIPLGHSRKELPIIRPITGNVTISGMLNTPPTYFSLGQIQESAQRTFPLRVEFVNLVDLATILNHALYPYILHITPKDPAAYASIWQVNIIPPERHKGYAVQWFALAWVLLILCFVLSKPRRSS